MAVTPRPLSLGTGPLTEAIEFAFSRVLWRVGLTLAPWIYRPTPKGVFSYGPMRNQCWLFVPHMPPALSLRALAARTVYTTRPLRVMSRKNGESGETSSWELSQLLLVSTPSVTIERL